jgi:cob(I)alamin adenosyltransferase
MATRIYTKTGDKGTTSLIGGTKVSKSNLRIEAYGTVDELNSFIGLLNDHLHTAPASATGAAGSANATNSAPASFPGTSSGPLFPDAQSMLSEIQDRLFTIGSSLACDPEKVPKLKIPDLKEDDIRLLEPAIATMETELPPMKSFLLPGGHPAVSTAHITRCVCRRAERGVVRLQDEQAFVDPLVLRYLNRLSDYLFVLARYIGLRLAVPEIPWKPRV